MHDFDASMMDKLQGAHAFIEGGHKNEFGYAKGLWWGQGKLSSKFKMMPLSEFLSKSKCYRFSDELTLFLEDEYEIKQFTPHGRQQWRNFRDCICNYAFNQGLKRGYTIILDEKLSLLLNRSVGDEVECDHLRFSSLDEAGLYNRKRKNMNMELWSNLLDCAPKEEALLFIDDEYTYGTMIRYACGRVWDYVHRNGLYKTMTFDDTLSKLLRYPEEATQSIQTQIKNHHITKI